MRQTADISFETLTKLKHVGFWRSDKQPTLPDPHALVDESWDAVEREQVINYLEAGYFIPIAQAGSSWCRFGCSPKPFDIGTQDLTDGTWTFPEGLVHYVRSHCIKPPMEFLQHMQACNFQVPVLPVLNA